MKSLRRMRWFTLVEVLIVIIIVWIMLGSTVFLWFAYLKTMQVRNEKQSITSMYNEFSAVARTSNYHGWVRYDLMNMTIQEWVISADIDLSSGTSEDIWSFSLEDLSFVFSGSDSWWTIDISITPYKIGCSQIWVSDLGMAVTGVDLQVVSSINNDVYCFTISEDTCKLTENRCS